MYLFEFEINDLMKAAHAMEISFAFSNVTYNAQTRPEARHVENMSEAWISFARTGDPNHPAMPQWPEYSVEKRATMIFDAISHVVNDPQGDERRAWKDFKLSGSRR